MNLRDEVTCHLKGDDVRVSPMTLTIRMTRRADPDDKRRRPVVCFREDGWSLPLNKVNLRTLTAAFGWETADWLGKRVEAHFDSTVIFDGKIVGGVRLRIAADQPTAHPFDHFASEAVARIAAEAGM